MAAPLLKTPRTCSQCGHNGHNARTCTADHSGGAGGFMLFGVRLTAAESSPTNSPASVAGSAFRKSVSMNNLSMYEQHPQDSSGNAATDGGYASDDALHAAGSRRSERKRGIPWTEEEHKLFLIGLKKVGKGDWRGISRNFVKTRTPTQVASHAQKYFLRRTNVNNRRRRRSSLFDITTDAVTNSAIEEEPFNQNSSSQSVPPPPPPVTPNLNSNVFPKPLSPKQTCPVPLIPVPPSAKMANLNLNQSPSSSASASTNTSTERELEPFLSLKRSSTPSDNEGSVSRAFGELNSNGDSIISVA
ncbi:hypothetical protein Cgig2_006999 [Carnegiea gigantea]|uniref:Uncharacterized protein n=1 Tax=Carnegiea gigantea TaxID=171969 RepID=A0A9Q1QET0_9CARY|nr:hypothetical protein Cgig2_006999 [Carnegiea gigantea]